MKRGHEDGVEEMEVKVPRVIRESNMVLHVQKTLSFHVAAALEGGIDIVDAALVADLFPGNTPATGQGLTYEWYLMPTQSWELYLTPMMSTQILMLGGPYGTMKALEANAGIITSAIRMVYPNEARQYAMHWKSYEDQDSILFGHPAANVVAQNPSKNVITLAQAGISGLGTLAAANLSKYQHSINTANLINDATKNAYQLNLENTGGVEYHCPGATKHYKWKISGPATRITNMTNPANAPQGVFNLAGVGNPTTQIISSIGATNCNFPIQRYIPGPLTSRSTASISAPKLVLVACPILGAVPAELQLRVQYNMTLSIERPDNFDYSGAYNVTDGRQTLANPTFKPLIPDAVVESGKSQFPGLN